MKKQILIIDDDALVMRTLERLLTMAGYMIDKAYNGEEAINYLKTKKYDLIISDIKMPGISGIQTIEYFREQEKAFGKHTPIIFMTGYASEDAPVEAFRLNVADYILKPFDSDKLIQSIKRALESNFEIDVEVETVRKLIINYERKNAEKIYQDQDLRSLFHKLTDLFFKIQSFIVQHK